MQLLFLKTLKKIVQEKILETTTVLQFIIRKKAWYILKVSLTVQYPDDFCHKEIWGVIIFFFF